MLRLLFISSRGRAGAVAARLRDVEYEVAEDRDSALKCLEYSGVSAVLADDSVPGVFELVRDRPLIFLAEDDEQGLEAMQSGAADYVTMDGLARLAPVLEREIRNAATRRERTQLWNELRQHKDRFRRTFDTAPIGIATISEAARFTTVNERFAEIVGYKRRELVGRRFSDMLHADEVGDAEARHAAFAEGVRSTMDHERRFVHKDGRTIWARVTLTPVFGDGEELEQVIALIHDITQQRVATQRAARQSAAAHLGHRALSGASLDELFQHASKLICEVLELELCEVLEADGDRLIVVAGSGLEPGLIGSIHPLSERPFVAMTLGARTPMVTSDVTADPRFQPAPLLLRHGARGGAAVPIGAAGEPWGLIGAYAKHERTLAEPDVDFLRTIATVLGQSIERVRSDVEVRIRAAQQSAIAELGMIAFSTVDQHTLERACELAQNGLGIEYALIHERVEGQLVVRAGQFWMKDLPSSTSVSTGSQSGIAATSRVPVVVTDYPTDMRFRESARAAAAAAGVRSGISVPITGSRLFYGVFSVYSGQRRAYTDADVHFMQSLANIVAEALEREHATRERRRIEQERGQLTSNLQLLLESTAEGIFTIDEEGRPQLVNRAAARMLQRSMGELAGLDMCEFLHGRVEHECPILGVLRSGNTIVVADETFRRADETTFPVEYSAAPLIDNGRIVGVVVTFTDISERRKLEAKLEQANRLSSLGRLAATIAHEFNNVLMGIAPFVEVIRRTNARDRIDASLGQIALSIARGKRITGEILRFTHPAVPVRARVDVAEWLRAVSTEARTLLPPTCVLDVSSEEGAAIDGDVSQLHQTMTNLILNARNAMPGGGTIAIRATLEKPGIVHLSVADTGTGMSEETRRHIFEPLFTTKKSGTGLGLPLAHQIVARHGGEITVESTLGAGTTFHLFLPACERDAEPQPEPAPPAAPVRLRRILLVEDDAAVAAGIVSLLEMEGLDIDIIDNGTEAIELIDERPPDVVVLDVGLPDMDGTAVYERIAVTHPDLPVIFSTGHADQSSLEKYLVRPNVSSLLKPYDGATLLDAIERVG
jgi:two-component system, cell cycle sensor histidine kinase and response regulator CckA